MNHFDQFLRSLENPNTARVAKHVLKNAPPDIDRYTLNELNNFIISIRPKSEKQITTIRYILGLYAKWLIDQDSTLGFSFYNNTQKINKKQLWKEAKIIAEQKFLSYEQYLSILHDISIYEDYNPLYYEVLFSSIYEGLYCEDLSVLKNLRGSDIDENLITLHDDNGNTYHIYVSMDLSNKLQKLSTLDTWRRPNRYGICNVPMVGLYPDSVFKVEQRKTQSDESRRFPYYSRLRKIKDEYIGYNILPLHIYVSGIVHRIKYLLSKSNITLEEAFADNCRNQLAHQIIVKELYRCNNLIEIGNFREIIKGHIDVFANDSTNDMDERIFKSIVDEEVTEEYLEGEELVITHLSHERNAEVILLAKERFKNSHYGNLFCEICGFDFKSTYGERGADYIEAHHIRPISVRSRNEATKVDDIALLCSNCHSIVHRKQPWLSMLELKEILNK